MYTLGIDIGTTFTAAAVCRDGRAQLCPLSSRSATLPSVVLIREDGRPLVGEPAQRRALTEPQRVAREFKRRFGDTTPLLLGGEPHSPEELTALVLRAVVDDVAARQGEPPTRVGLCHPANWGRFKTDLLRRSVELAGIDVPVVLVSEPEAAAIAYAQEERLAEGDTVAVYDLGGGTFDAAVVTRVSSGGFHLLGEPEGIDRLGGMDVDAAVYAHVMRTLGERLADLELDEDDEASVSAVARLKQECVEAKEALSSDTDASIPVLMPGLTTSVRLTRAELETMVRPALYSTVEALRRALRSAAVAPEDLRAVLLVGGSSRIPLVAQLVGAELGRPVAVDAEPKFSVALGAAWLAAEGFTAGEPATAPTAAPPLPVGAVTAPTAAPPLPVGAVTAPTAAPPLPVGAVTAPATAPPPGVAREPMAAAALPATPRSDVRRRLGAGAAAAIVTATSLGVWFAMDRNAASSTAEPAAGSSTSSTGSGTTAASSASVTSRAVQLTPVGTTRALVIATSTSTSSTARATTASRSSTTKRTTSTSTTTSTTSTTSRPSATAVPAAVTSLAASRGRPTGSTATSVRVRWAPSPGATSYLVQWREVGGTGSGTSATTTSSSFTITGLAPGTRYNVRVTPRNSRGAGSPTTVTGATTLS